MCTPPMFVVAPAAHAFTQQLLIEHAWMIRVAAMERQHIWWTPCSHKIRFLKVANINGRNYIKQYELSTCARSCI